MLKVKSIYLLAIIVGGLIGLATKSTYALFTSSTEIDNPICMSTNLTSEEDTIDTIKVVVAAKKDEEVPITIKNTTSTTLGYSVWYDQSLDNVKIGINLSKTDGSPSVGNVASNDSKKVYVQIKNNSDQEVTILLGVISNPTANSMNLIPNNELTIGVNLVEYITNLYNTAEKSEVVNNATTPITYNYATSVSLMNDRLGSSNTDINGGNIRYYGNTPNNYIYFNCDDYTNQSSDTCEKWRIIGVFDGKVKIIRNDSIGDYSWDNKGRTTGAETSQGKNNWADARLMTMLNEGYESEVGGGLYWNRQSGTCYSGLLANKTKTCDLSTVGLKNDTTREMIESVKYSLYGHNSTSIYADAAYNYERFTGSVYNTDTRDTEWTGKIALAYPSDYGYAADLSLCSRTIYEYDKSECKNNNWMFKGIIEWLITPQSSSSISVWSIVLAGSVYASDIAYGTSEIRPVLYLSSDVEITTKNMGTELSPYQIIKE